MPSPPKESEEPSNNMEVISNLQNTVLATPRNDTKSGVKNWFKSLSFPFGKGKPSSTENLREALEEYIEELGEDEEMQAFAQHEQSLITNILKLRDLTVLDVMIPRADIVAIDVETSQDDLMKLLSEKQFSRIPVFEGDMDNIIGTVHIKDLVSRLVIAKDIHIKELLRDAPIVSPAMHVLDLMLQMRQSKKHMVMVVDEYGGIDGLVTIGDVLESIVGEIDDEFDQDEDAVMLEKPDGSILADARVDIDEFEERYGEHLSEEERDDIDTLGGLVFSVAGRIPARGEVIKHNSGMVFEVLDADPRRINRLRIKNIPQED